jgi:hypothetical protein
LALGLVAPSTHASIFDGIPLNSRSEVVGLVVLLCCAVVFKAHRSLQQVLKRKRAGYLALLGVLIALIPLRFVAFAHSDESGRFRACYQPTNEWSAGSQCEPSFENFARSNATRFDSVIDFGEREESPSGTIVTSNWNLGFVNDLRFNVYPWENGNPDLVRFPFEAAWSADLAGYSSDRLIRITHIGEGTLRLGAETFELTTSYSTPVTQDFVLRSGEHEFELNFTFDSLVSRSDSVVPGPYAAMKVGIQEPDSGEWSLLSPKDLGWGVRAFGVINDLVYLTGIAAIALSAVLSRRRTFLHALAVVVPVAAVCSLASGTLASLAGFSVPIWIVALAGAAAVSWLLFRQKEALGVGLPLLGLVLTTNLTTRIFPTLTYVDFKDRGGDWLTYEHMARGILASRSLQGGEDVFFYQPAFRYMLFISHMLFGDGNWGITFLLTLVFIGGVLYLVWRISRLSLGGNEKFVWGLAGSFTALALLFLHSEPLQVLLSFPTTEIPNWGILIVVAALLLPRPSLRHIAIASSLLGLTIVTRPNHLFVALALMGFIVWANRALLRNRKTLMTVIGPFVGVSLLPLIHNLWYGRRFVLLTSGSDVVRDLSFGEFMTFPTDAEVRQVLGDKIKLFFNQSPIADGGSAIRWLIAGFIALWIVGLVMVVSRRQWRSANWLLLVVPLAYLPTMILYEVLIYYPRHILALHLGFGVFGLVVAVLASNPRVDDLDQSTTSRPQRKQPARSRR